MLFCEKKSFSEANNSSSKLLCYVFFVGKKLYEIKDVFYFFFLDIKLAFLFVKYKICYYKINFMNGMLTIFVYLKS